MTAREFLNSLRTTEIFIRQRDDQLKELRALAYDVGSPSLDSDRVQSSGGSTPWQMRQAEEIADMELRNKAIRMELVRQRQEAIEMIQALTDRAQIILLEQRYVKAKSWKNVCKEMSKSGLPYADSYVRFKLHNRAIEEFEKIYNKSQKLS